MAALPYIQQTHHHEIFLIRNKREFESICLQITVAIKIFANQKCFENEQRIYSTTEVASALGAAPRFFNNRDRAACTPYGYIFPPFTISDRCESLESVMSRGPLAFNTVMQACASLR